MVFEIFSKTWNCLDDKAGHCGKRHNGRNVLHFSPVFPKMRWQPSMIFETVSKECFSSQIKGSFIQMLFLIPKSQRGHALNILTSSEAGLDWNGNIGASTCVATSFGSIIKKKKKKVQILIKSSAEFSFAWSSVTWNSGKAIKLRVLSLFWESPYGTWQAHSFLTSAEAAVPVKPWHCLKYWESAGIQFLKDKHHEYPNISSKSWHL